MICKASHFFYGVWERKKDECMELGKQALMEEILVNYFFGRGFLILMFF
jgi:hypothetical protein